MTENLVSTAAVPLLTDKVVVLSGVGPGLGRSLGEEAAKLGADLVLVSRTQKRLDKMAEVVPFDALADRLPHFAENQITAEQYTERIAARQVGIARRMIS